MWDFSSGSEVFIATGKEKKRCTVTTSLTHLLRTERGCHSPYKLCLCTTAYRSAGHASCCGMWHPRYQTGPAATPSQQYSCCLRLLLAVDLPAYPQPWNSGERRGSRDPGSFQKTVSSWSFSRIIQKCLWMLEIKGSSLSISHDSSLSISDEFSQWAKRTFFLVI